MPINFAPATPIKTDRLVLRGWREGDIEPFVAMGADQDVMRYFPATMTREEVLSYSAELQERQRKWGFNFWAVETADMPFIGFIGLSRPKDILPFAPCVEIGWRLTPAAWGKGYATEGARAALKAGFDHHNLDEIISMASLVNLPSLRVMEKIGMVRDVAGDFDHPALKDHRELERCALYRISRERFKEVGN